MVAASLRGPEAVETEITLDELRASYPGLVKKAEEALQRFIADHPLLTE